MANSWGIPKAIEDAVLERDKSCVYCGCKFGSERAKKRSWEHIINDITITGLDNIALCCVGCNASKGAKLLKDWVYSDRSVPPVLCVPTARRWTTRCCNICHRWGGSIST